MSSITFPMSNHLPCADVHTLLTDAEAKLAVTDPGSAFTDVACDTRRCNLVVTIPLLDITAGFYTTKS